MAGKMRYSWAPGCGYSGAARAQRAGEFIATLTGKTPRDVLKAARARSSPIHEFFDWDDTVAAKRWRLRQAQELVKAVHVVYVDSAGESQTVRAFVNLYEGRAETGPFYSTLQVLSDKDQRKIVLRRALAEAEAWRKRYEQYDELAAICAAIRRSVRRRRRAG